MTTINETAEMKITAIAPWFGGKRTMAPVIVQELGKHRAYWEPFCGGMSVLLAKPASSHETVNDLNGNLINLARVIADPVKGAQLYRRLRRVWMDERVRDEMLARMKVAEDPIERALTYFIASWTGRNGFAGTKGWEKSSFAVRWTPGGGHGGQRLASVVDSVPAFRRRMRRVTILNRDAFDVIDKIDDTDGVSIYVDSPYIEKDGEYEHDFAAAPGGMFPDDHLRLARSLSRFQRARVVVSYYRHQRLADLYPPEKWTHRDCTVSKGLHNAGKRGQKGTAAPEVLLINGPSLAGTP